MQIKHSHDNKPANPLTVVASVLSQTMRFRLLDGCYSQGSSTVLGSRATRAALRRRGLIAEDNRWTDRGRAVAAIIRGGDAPYVKTLDELHELASEEDGRRFPVQSNIFAGTPSDAANHMANKIKQALSPREVARASLPRGGNLANLADYTSVTASPLPDPTVTGPCQAQATFMCTGEAAGERLNPLAMLPGSTVSAGYVPMCQPCYDHLADAYVAALHTGGN